MNPQYREKATRAGEAFRQRGGLEAALDILDDCSAMIQIWCLREFTGIDLPTAVHIVEGRRNARRFNHIGPQEVELIRSVPRFGGEHGHWIRQSYVYAVLDDQPVQVRRRFFAEDDEDPDFEAFRDELNRLADTDPFLRPRVDVEDTECGLRYRFTLA